MRSDQFDAVWNYVVATWFDGVAAKPHRAMIGRIVHDFVDLGAMPDEIAWRRKNYIATWPQMECSPTALVKHWHRFKKPPKHCASAIREAETMRRGFADAEYAKKFNLKDGTNG